MQENPRTKRVTWAQVERETWAQVDDGAQESEEEGSTSWSIEAQVDDGEQENREEVAISWSIEHEYRDMNIAQAQGHWAVALHDFDASEFGPEYMHLQKGEQIFVWPVSPHDQGWRHAWSNRLGEYGWIPANYVSLRD